MRSGGVAYGTAWLVPVRHGKVRDFMVALGKARLGDVGWRLVTLGKVRDFKFEVA